MSIWLARPERFSALVTTKTIRFPTKASRIHIVTEVDRASESFLLGEINAHWPGSYILSEEAKVEVSRFKGLGEMMAAQLKETTMDPKRRTLLKVMLIPDDRKDTEKSVERLMGTKPEARFAFIQEKAEFASEQLLDV